MKTDKLSSIKWKISTQQMVPLRTLIVYPENMQFFDIETAYRGLIYCYLNIREFWVDLYKAL